MFWDSGIKGSGPDHPSPEREGARGGAADVRRGDPKPCVSPREIRGRMSKHWKRREVYKRLSLENALPEYMDANKCIDELLKQLEEERRNVRREKLAVARLQREVARSKSEETMREKLIHELEEERCLRLESEKRLREVTEESDLGRAHMVSLQQQFSRMEETVRSLLQNQGLEQTAVDTVDLMKAYKDKLSEEVQKQHGGTEEGSVSRSEPVLSTDEDLERGQGEDRTSLLLERLKTLEEQNSVLTLENENQREQYERCLDEVANQVVQALLTQKDLREECVKLRTRVFDLEQQNRALSVLFQQKIKPASDLLLQKLHSRIMDLSAADLLLEPDRSKAVILSRNSDSPSNDVQVNGKAGFPVTKCVSQLSLTSAGPERPPLYPRSSCSSSELSLSSACSDFSSGSYTWNDGRSTGKMQSSLTWEKRLSLGSSAPSNIHRPVEEPVPTRRKECRILEGLRKLQRRKHRSVSASRVSKSCKDKDCMNSNEGIYSLGFKGGAKGVSKTGHVSRATGTKRFSYDSDDADDELVNSNRSDNIPTKDSWFHCKKSHSISESLCSWEGLQDNAPSGGSSDPIPAKNPPGYDSKDRPEKLLSFINSFLPEGERKSAFSKPCKLHVVPPDSECPNRLSDMEDTEELISESSDIQLPFHPQVVDREPKRLSRDSTKFLPHQHLKKDIGRTQSADGRPSAFTLIKDPKVAKQCTQSEESILAIFDAEGEPIELCSQKCLGGNIRRQHDASRVLPDYSELIPQERPTRQKSARNYTVLESPEKPSEFQSRLRKPSNSREASEERLSLQVTPQRRLIKPPSSRVSKGHSIPPMNEPAGAKTCGSKIPGRNKPSASPLRVSKGSTTEPTANSGPPAQDKSPLSPTVKVPRFVKSQGINCTQSPKSVKLASRIEWTKGSIPGSPHLPRRHLEFIDNGEQPTSDKHCETSKNKLRSPSPPPPPGRTTSLLVRPNYENSPQAHKSAMVHQSTTVRGPPPSYNQANMQATLPIKDKDCSDFSTGYGTALSPQKLVDKTSQHLQKSPSVAQTKSTSKRLTKDYLPSSNSGCAPEPEPKPSKNVPPPYSAHRGSSFQNSFAAKRGSSQEHQTVQKTSISLPISLEESPQPKTEPPKAILSPPSSVVTSPKSRIPMGFKAFLKSPPSQKSSTSIPGKLEKDHINSVSKDTVTSNASFQCDGTQQAFDIVPPSTTIDEAKFEDPEENGQLEDECGRRGSQLFSRSISVTTKPHLKPALGMTGAKARSQSFSTNYMDKPSINSTDVPGRIRTQIITNSGERGSSLSRQSSLEVPHVESPIHSPRSRVSHYGGMTGSNSHNIIPERTSKCGSKGEDSFKGEGVTSPSQKEARSLPISDRTNNIRKPSKVASHPQFQIPSYKSDSPLRDKVGSGSINNEPDFIRETDLSKNPLDVEEKKTSPTACTIEERVMMGIEENLQKCQEQEKVAANEAKKTGPSLANWFGLRKSKLPALSGSKKADSPKGKEEKKELKIGSVLGGKQLKSDKKKEKKKADSQQEGPATNLVEVNNKLSTIMDHCNNQMGQIANQIQCTTAFIGKEQFVKEILGRTAVKGSSVAAPHGISSPKKQTEMDAEICHDSSMLIMSPKLNPKAENEEGHIMDSSCQDHMIGSSCQMRTLDSGIGTFPLPKSESCGPMATTSDAGSSFSSSQPDDVTISAPPLSRLHAPPLSRLGHSLSDPTVTQNNKPDGQSRLPKLSTSDAIRTKRSSVCAPHVSASADERREVERRSRGTEHDTPGERALRVCTYSGSSSETETELESPNKSTSGSVDQSEQTLKRCSVGKGLSIMDYYQTEVYPGLEEGRRLSRYSLLQEGALDTKPGDRLSKEIPLEKSSPVISNQPVSLDLSLESLNKLNQSSSAGLYPDTVLKDADDCCMVDKPCSATFSSKPAPDKGGSFSDSLYDSFSSCTSQGSNEV